jgi:hypothetical protein
MWTTVITAPETLLRLSGFNLRREHRKLFRQFIAAAMGAFPDALVASAFQQFGYPAALAAFIFVNRHRFTP